MLRKYLPGRSRRGGAAHAATGKATQWSPTFDVQALLAKQTEDLTAAPEQVEAFQEGLPGTVDPKAGEIGALLEGLRRAG